MQSNVDETLVNESERYRFRFTCEHCVHFADGERTCTLGYPVEPHHLVDLRSVKSVQFCKLFELC